ncbi:Phosphate acyltransferase [Sinobacterium norvegicum]|uniref:Phosphate acyltransferase n=2 Tax=Sinobacterium norvegicum TaxID=1641715 RepID=A0ABM9AA77_9GAMM|nr:Phosphate acyltransferase [Sinobacterium norvegicum]
MGGDFGPRTTVPASIESLKQDDNLKIVLFGDQAQISPYLASIPPVIKKRLSIVHCEQVVAMSDKPSFALRHKKSSSMRQAIEYLHQGKADGCVSAGNTGALMGIGCYVLKTYPGIDRPAICTAIPTLGGHSYLLDLGANVDTNSDNLYQFALMGSVLASAVDGLHKPRVALLNIGEEEVKGNGQVKHASALLSAQGEINYTGYVEGDHLFSGVADVIVCDGFVGNIALKTSEGVVKFIASLSEQMFGGGAVSKLLMAAVKPLFDRLQARIDPQQYNGAYFLGLQGLVVKSHGNANVEGFVQAISSAGHCIKKDMVVLMEERLDELLP